MTRASIQVERPHRLLPVWALVLATLLVGCIGEEREQQLGDELAAELNLSLPLVSDDAVLFHIAEVGSRIVEVSDRPEQEYTFYLVNSDIVNAFSLPGGHIYLTRALLERTESAAELAGVIAHEVAHVAARHGVRRLEREMRSGSLITAMYEIFLGGEPALLDNPAVRLSEQLGSGLHSRSDEREADRHAVRYLVQAGYSPEAYISFLQTIAEDDEDAPAAAEWFSTHPSTDSRIALAREKIETLEGAVDKERAGSQDDRAAHRAFLVRLSLLPEPLTFSHGR